MNVRRHRTPRAWPAAFDAAAVGVVVLALLTMVAWALRIGWLSALCTGPLAALAILLVWSLRRNDHRRREIETALRNAERTSRSLLDSSGEGIYGVDLQGRCTFINRAAAAMLEYEPHEVLGQNVFALFHRVQIDPSAGFSPAASSSAASTSAASTSAAGTSDQSPLPLSLRMGTCCRADNESLWRKDGVPFPAEYSSHPVWGPGQELTGAVVTFTDITARKQVEAALNHERYLLHTLMEYLPDSIYFKDASSRFLRISRACASKFGLSDASEALGKTDRDFFTAEHAERAMADEWELMQSGQPVLGKEEQETWSDGHSTWVASTKLPLLDRTGRVIGTFGISRDITERKRAEQALRESEARQRAILNAALDAIITIDHEGKIVDVNPAAERTFGYRRDEVIGQESDSFLFPGSSGERQRENLERYSASGEQGSLLGRRLEFPAKRKNGESFVAEMAMQPILREGAPLFTMFLRDITDRKRAEAALREAAAASDAANRAKSDFLANMSHEIRTPLNAVIGMTELILDTELTGPQREYLLMVRESGESLLNLLNDILDFSKIEAGKLDLEEISFDLREHLGDSMKLLGLRAHRKGLELACHVTPDVPTLVVGDPGRLRQIVINLVGNSIKFTERGEIVLDVECKSDAPAGIVLHFAVTDTGIGIPRDKLGRIFEAFEQADTSTTRKFGGTGLGLTISSRLVDLMGGRIWVESEEGLGSTFHFTAHFAHSTAERPTPMGERAATIRGLRVLVVDDNATNCRILHEMLRNWDMDPTVANGANAALEALHVAQKAGDRYGLVLTDANMPEIDGFMFAERIQEDPELQSPVIMMLTSGDRPGDIARCEQLGFAAHLIKPIKQSELLDAIMAAVIIETPHAAHGGSGAAEAVAARRLQILLAEDSLVNQKLAVGILEKWGHTVVVANNGREAVDLAATQEFDLILMDVQMPEMDGLQATSAIRALERQGETHVPIVAMTAHAMKGDRELCLSSGMDGYVPKPIRAAELRSTIEACCNARLRPETDPHDLPDASAAQEDSVLGTELNTDPHHDLPPLGEIADWSLALEAVQNDHPLLLRVVAALLEETPRLLEQLREAIERSETGLVQRLAHTIKGTVRTFGAEAVTAPAARMESLAEDGNLSEALPLFHVVQAGMERLRDELIAYVNDDASVHQ